MHVVLQSLPRIGELGLLQRRLLAFPFQQFNSQGIIAEAQIAQRILGFNPAYKARNERRLGVIVFFQPRLQFTGVEWPHHWYPHYATRLSA